MESHRLAENARFLSSLHCRASPKPQISGNDHEGAYRHFPVRDPHETYLLLWTAKGLTIWRHNVLLFGSTASVWAYNRMGDVLCFLAPMLGFAPVAHYVDDYGCMEAEASAQSSLHFFKKINNLMNFRMKLSKEQPPADRHKMQGVHIAFENDHIRLSTAASRIKKILGSIAKSLLMQSLPPEEAGTMAGKLGFVGTAVFGKVGRAPRQQLYIRQHVIIEPPYRLTIALSSALRTLRHICHTCDQRD